MLRLATLDSSIPLSGEGYPTWRVNALLLCELGHGVELFAHAAAAGSFLPIAARVPIVSGIGVLGAPLRCPEQALAARCF